MQGAIGALTAVIGIASATGIAIATVTINRIADRERAAIERTDHVST